MFSYRHAFHAGNHADVLKHTVLVQIFDHLLQKEKPFWYFDTHSGAGRYDLGSQWARKTHEADTGIGRIWNEPKPPAAVARYLELVRANNPDGQLRMYPGSPWLAWQMLGERDRLRLFEMHANEVGNLHESLRQQPREVARRTMVYAADGFTNLKALLPPPPRRGVILIDPAYEDKNDYRKVMHTVREGLERFATGCYAIWYPMIQRYEAQQLPEKLARIPGIEWLHATLLVGDPKLASVGLHGSGMFVINPPHTLKGALQSALPWLANTLAGPEGRFTLKTGTGPRRAPGASHEYEGDDLSTSTPGSGSPDTSAPRSRAPRSAGPRGFGTNSTAPRSAHPRSGNSRGTTAPRSGPRTTGTSTGQTTRAPRPPRNRP